MQLPHWQTLLFVNAGLLVAGSFLEPPAAILILTPLLLPVVEAAGVNALHFGIIMAVNLSIGLYMPPFGLNLFAAKAIFNVPMGMIYRGVLPFVVVNFLALLVITYVPAISMVLLRRSVRSLDGVAPSQAIFAGRPRRHRPHAHVNATPCPGTENGSQPPVIDLAAR